jgi:hypothetical protein
MHYMLKEKQVSDPDGFNALAKEYNPQVQQRTVASRGGIPKAKVLTSPSPATVPTETTAVEREPIFSRLPDRIARATITQVNCEGLTKFVCSTCFLLINID